MSPGPLIIVSGPSGSGKSTLIRRVLDDPPYPLRLAVSATTRPPRPGEEDGKHYHFISAEEFQRRLDAGEFLEHYRVHGHHEYGTPRAEVDPWRERGYGVILDIDVHGFEQVRRVHPDCVSIFVDLPRWEMYEERLRRRGTETEAGIARRLATARRELERQGEYEHVVINDDLNTAAAQFRQIIEGARPSER
jgi:guanylate kinase